MTKNKNKWEEQYPLNTFKGETKKELVAVIKEAEQDGYNRGRKDIIHTLKQRLAYCLEQNGIDECKNCGLCVEDFN